MPTFAFKYINHSNRGKYSGHFLKLPHKSKHQNKAQPLIKGMTTTIENKGAS